jgi:hypothetical protein
VSKEGHPLPREQGRPQVMFRRNWVTEPMGTLLMVPLCYLYEGRPWTPVGPMSSGFRPHSNLTGPRAGQKTGSKPGLLSLSPSSKENVPRKQQRTHPPTHDSFPPGIARAQGSPARERGTDTQSQDWVRQAQEKRKNPEEADWGVCGGGMMFMLNAPGLILSNNHRAFAWAALPLGS